jgi:hypothetical protein
VVEIRPKNKYIADVILCNLGSGKIAFSKPDCSIYYMNLGYPPRNPMMFGPEKIFIKMWLAH